MKITKNLLIFGLSLMLLAACGSSPKSFEGKWESTDSHEVWEFLEDGSFFISGTIPASGTYSIVEDSRVILEFAGLQSIFGSKLFSYELDGNELILSPDQGGNTIELRRITSRTTGESSGETINQSEISQAQTAVSGDGNAATVAAGQYVLDSVEATSEAEAQLIQQAAAEQARSCTERVKNNLNSGNYSDFYPGTFLSGCFLPEAQLFGLDLSGANLDHAEFPRADLTNINLDGASLKNTHFNNANLAGANLSNTNLISVNFYGSNLANVNFSNAILDGQDLVGKNLSGANFQKASLTFTRIEARYSGELRNSEALLDLTMFAYNGDYSKIWDMAVSPDAKYLAIGDSSKKLYIWDLENMFISDILNLGEQPWVIEWSHDGAFVAATGYSGTVKVWEINSGEEILSSDQQYCGLDWHPTLPMLAYCKDDETIGFWDVNNPEPIEPIIFETDRSNNKIRVLSWSPVGDKLLVAWRFGRITLIDPFEKTRIYGYTAFDKEYSVQSFAWSPDGESFVGAYPNHLVFWDIHQEEPNRFVNVSYADFGDVAWHPSSPILVSVSASTGRGLGYWDPYNYHELENYVSDGSVAVDWHPSGQYLYTVIGNFVYRVPVYISGLD